jgi:hypothetical protein
MNTLHELELCNRSQMLSLLFQRIMSVLFTDDVFVLICEVLYYIKETISDYLFGRVIRGRWL